MDPQDVYSRLAEKGLSADQVDYVRRLARIGVVVPFWPAYFHKHYGRDKSVKKILSAIEHWQKVIKDDFLIEEKIKSKIYRDLLLAKYATYHAIIAELFPVEYAKVRFHFPAIEAKVVSMFEASPMPVKCIEYIEKFIKRIEEALDNELKDFRRKARKIGRLYSEYRGAQWHGALFTKLLIPGLFEYLFPFYKTAPHRNPTPADSHRQFANYPGPLMKDISDILLGEYPNQRTTLTPEMVKAAVDRYQDNPKPRQYIKTLLEHRYTSSGEAIEEVLKLRQIAKIE